MSQLILVAPAAFKGTLGPRRVADALAVGARRALPGAAVLQCPIADGGDGLLDAVLAPAALRERLSVTGPLGEPVSGELGWVDPETAIFESATACGIALLKPEQLDPLRATTRGVGELVWEAVERGAKTVVVGLGGSATVHGGGALATLPGGGAAGGLGAGLVCFAKAELTSGADWVLERVGFDAALAKAQLVITGEGSFDKTSLVGKASGEVVRRAQAAKTRVAVVAGERGGGGGPPRPGREGRVVGAALVAGPPAR